MVISSVAPNNSLTAPLMHSKMPIETADNDDRDRPMLRREKKRDAIFICRKEGGMPVYSHGKRWPFGFHFEPKERRGTNPQPKLTFIAAPFPTKQPPRRGFSGSNGGLIHLVSGRYGAEIGRILCHDPNRGGGGRDTFCRRRRESCEFFCRRTPNRTIGG